MRYGLTRWDTLDFESSHIEDQQGRGWSLNQVRSIDVLEDVKGL